MVNVQRWGLVPIAKRSTTEWSPGDEAGAAVVSPAIRGSMRGRDVPGANTEQLRELAQSCRTAGKDVEELSAMV